MRSGAGVSSKIDESVRVCSFSCARRSDTVVAGGRSFPSFMLDSFPFGGRARSIHAAREKILAPTTGVVNNGIPATEKEARESRLGNRR